MISGLRGHAGRPAPRAFVRGAVLGNRRPYGVSETLGEFVIEGNLSALDGADGCCGNRGRLSELRLSEAAQDPIVTRKPLVDRDVYELAHRNVERRGDSGQQINLRRRVTGLPVVQRAAPDLGKASEVRNREVPRLANLRESAGRKAAHYAPTHRHAPGAAPPTMAIHCAAPSLRSSQAVSIERGIVQTFEVRC